MKHAIPNPQLPLPPLPSPPPLHGLPTRTHSNTFAHQGPRAGLCAPAHTGPPTPWAWGCGVSARVPTHVMATLPPVCPVCRAFIQRLGRPAHSLDDPEGNPENDDVLLVHGLYEADAQPEAFEEMDRRASLAGDGRSTKKGKA